MRDTINFNVYQQSDHYRFLNIFFKNILLSFHLLLAASIPLQKGKKILCNFTDFFP